MKDGNKIDCRGLVPESWACVDCGVNTAPGCTNRVQLEQAFAPLPDSALDICRPAATAGSTAQIHGLLEWPVNLSSRMPFSRARRGAGNAGIMPHNRPAVCAEYRPEPTKPQKSPACWMNFLESSCQSRSPS